MDGFVGRTTPAERALRRFALGRRAWLFAGSERGADRAAAIVTLITTPKLKEIDPLVWLADVLARINGHPATGTRRSTALELEGHSGQHRRSRETTPS